MVWATPEVVSIYAPFGNDLAWEIHQLVLSFLVEKGIPFFFFKCSMEFWLNSKVWNSNRFQSFVIVTWLRRNFGPQLMVITLPNIYCLVLYRAFPLHYYSSACMVARSSARITFCLYARVRVCPSVSLGTAVSFAFSEHIHNSHSLDSLVFLLKGEKTFLDFSVLQALENQSDPLPNFRIYLIRSFIEKMRDSSSMEILRDSKLLSRCFLAILAIRVSF